MSKRMLWILNITQFIIILALIGFFTFKSATKFQAPIHEKINTIYGVCTSSLTSPVTDSNYLRLQVILKGSDLNLRDFEWNNVNYVSHPGCFVDNSQHSEHRLNNFIRWNRKDSLIPMYALIRSTATNNEFEFQAKVFNLKNELIGSFPENGGTYKDIIPSLSTPATIIENVKLKTK